MSASDRAEDKRLNALPFRMPIEDFFYIKAKGNVVAGRVQQGVAHKGDRIKISGHDKQAVYTIISAFEGFIRDPDSCVAEAGDNCALLLHDIEINQLAP